MHVCPNVRLAQNAQVRFASSGGTPLCSSNACQGNGSAALMCEVNVVIGLGPSGASSGGRAQLRLGPVVKRKAEPIQLAVWSPPTNRKQFSSPSRQAT